MVVGGRAKRGVVVLSVSGTDAAAQAGVAAPVIGAPQCERSWASGGVRGCVPASEHGLNMGHLRSGHGGSVTKAGALAREVACVAATNVNGAGHRTDNPAQCEGHYLHGIRV